MGIPHPLYTYTPRGFVTIKLYFYNFSIFPLRDIMEKLIIIKHVWNILKKLSKKLLCNIKKVTSLKCSFLYNFKEYFFMHSSFIYVYMYILWHLLFLHKQSFRNWLINNCLIVTTSVIQYRIIINNSIIITTFPTLMADIQNQMILDSYQTS